MVAIIAGVVAALIAVSWPLSARVEWLAIGRSRPAMYALFVCITIAVITAFIAAALLSAPGIITE